MRESASTDLREPQGSNPLGPPGPELRRTARRYWASTASVRLHLNTPACRRSFPKASPGMKYRSFGSGDWR